jgi:UDPglucose 6-dehydrogenase
VIGWHKPGEVSPSRRKELADLLTPSGWPGAVHHTDSRTASMIKYASNCILAARLSIAQEIAMLSAEVGANGHEVLAEVGRDPRIGSRFLAAGAGWGGSCFPKDTRALVALGRDYGLPMTALDGAVVSNTFALSWVDKVMPIPPGFRLGKPASRTPQRVGWLGLSFKPGTSDTRRSPSVLAMLQVEDAERQIRAHDPEATLPCVIGPNVAKQVGTAREAVWKADVIVLATPWPEYVSALPDGTPMDPPAWVEHVAEGAVLIDCRNAFPREHDHRFAQVIRFGDGSA